MEYTTIPMVTIFRLGAYMLSCRGKTSSGSTRGGESEQPGAASDLTPSVSVPSLTARGKRSSVPGLHKPTSSVSLPDTRSDSTASGSSTSLPHVKKHVVKAASSSASSLETSTELYDHAGSGQRRLRLRKQLATEEEATSSNPKLKRPEQRSQESSSSSSARASVHARLKKRISLFQLRSSEEATTADPSELSEPSGLRQSLRKKKATGSCASNK